MHEEGRSLEEIYDWGENWEWLEEKVTDLLEGEETYEEGIKPKDLKEFLNNSANWSDDAIWETIIGICDERTEHHKSQIVALGKEEEKKVTRR